MKNQTLNNAFPIVAAALGNKFAVNVSVNGSTAFTDGKSITLPAYNNDDPAYKEVAFGYLAHEAGHLRFTDFAEFSNAATCPIRKSIVNILEDIRIEKAMQVTYPGTKRTTEKVVEHLVENGKFETLSSDEQAHPATVLAQFLLFQLRHDVLGQTALSSYADTAEVLLEETFPVGAVTRLMGLLTEVQRIQVTRDCVRLADSILRMIEEEQEKTQEEMRQQQAEQAQAQAEAEEKDDSDSSASEQQSADSEQDNQDQDSGVEQSIETPSVRDVEANEDSQPGKGGNKSPTHHDKTQNLDTERLAQNLASVLSAGVSDVPEDVFATAKELLSSQSQNDYDSTVCMPIAMPPETDVALGNKLLKKVLAESGKIRASLQGIVQASRYERPVHKRIGNRIDGKKLYRLVQGDSRVFAHKSQKKAPNTAIHLLVDGSGSMNETYGTTRLIDLAIETSMALALAFEGIAGVNPAVTRLPFENTDDVVPLLKHGQKLRPNAAAFTPVIDGGTPLAQALWYAASAVLATQENRKVIMVLTDGEPDDKQAVVSIINRCEATGIELIGIGICHDVQHLFKNAISINDVSELRSELFRISQEVLLAA